MVIAEKAGKQLPACQSFDSCFDLDIGARYGTCG